MKSSVHLYSLIFLHWRDVIGSVDGDIFDSDIVDVLLPYFARVACQDRIYWSDKFPLEPASNLLKQRLCTNEYNYEVWAAIVGSMMLLEIWLQFLPKTKQKY